jgi:hypothetical protein
MVSVWQEGLPESLEAILELFHKACRLCIRVTLKDESSLSNLPEQTCGGEPTCCTTASSERFDVVPKSAWGKLTRGLDISFACPNTGLLVGASPEPTDKVVRSRREVSEEVRGLMSGMFEITKDDIAKLGDERLRAVVARLCEAELRQRALSPSCVTGAAVRMQPMAALTSESSYHLVP